MAFQKASAVVGTKGRKRDIPDLEDAFEDSDDEGEIVPEEALEEEEEEDLSKDKMIKEKNTKGKGKGKDTASTNKREAKKAKKKA